MPGRIAIVTDSTASLTPELAAAHDITVVPLQVIVGSASYDDGTPEVAPDKIAEALREFLPVSTSRPAPAVMRETYESLAAEGYDEVLSIHLSAEMSGTFESAQLGAADASIPVRCVDSRQVGIATGFAAIAASRVVGEGGPMDDAVASALAVAQDCASLVYVDTLEYLRRGGRVGAAAALFGGALAVKPLLQISEGRVATLDKVRTASRALAKLADLAVEAAGERPVQVAVHHLANPERAATLAADLSARLADNQIGRAQV